LKDLFTIQQLHVFDKTPVVLLLFNTKWCLLCRQF